MLQAKFCNSDTSDAQAFCEDCLSSPEVDISRETIFSTRRPLVLTAPPSNALGSHGRLVAPLHSHSMLSRLFALRKPCGLRAQPAWVSLARVVAEYSCINNA